eukprot:TRINITY_DN41577_c0_g1_i1.p1 TRINITY_DN41577_c0_g1~~TRINITY_DN41577_c0_g1_i1.p1  ORF type:complete len:975 (-),score=190.38 TRINITY_DN41577_c0_g1_i1:140-3064(-)
MGDPSYSHHAGNHGNNHNRQQNQRNRQRGRQSAKHATFPLINQEVIAAAETGDVAKLLATIQNNLTDMNLVNLSTSLHRLAKMSNDTRNLSVIRQHDIFPQLLDRLHQALLRVEGSGTSPQCQALSNITWSLATVQYAHLPLLELLSRCSLKHVTSFKPFELSAMLWAYAKLDALDSKALVYADPLFKASADHVTYRVSEFSFRCLVMIAWAFATARHHDHAGLFSAVAAQMMPSIHTAQCQELANAAWAFSTAGCKTEGLFGEIAGKALRLMNDFKAADLSSLLWAFASANFFHEDFYNAAVRAMQHLEFDPSQLANVIWAMTKVRPRSNASQAALLLLVPRVLPALQGQSMQPQEFASIALAAAKCFGPPGGDRHYPGLPQPANGHVLLPSQVGAFFLSGFMWLLPRLPQFTGQALAQTVSSYLSVQMGVGTDLYVAFAHDIASRAQALDTSALLCFARFLPVAPQPVFHHALCMVFAEVSRRVRLDAFRSKDLQALSQICLTLTGTPSTDNVSVEWLANTCAEIGENGLASAAAAMQERNADPMTKLLDAPRLAFSVKNTFIEFDDPSAAGDEDTNQWSAMLPPTLGIIPESVSAEKLEAYRVGYQRFRAGNANGAKGELSVVTGGSGQGGAFKTRSTAEALGLEAATKRPSSDTGRLQGSGRPAVRTSHSNEDSYSESGTSSKFSVTTGGCSEDILKRLPPPIDRLPQYIDMEKLASYRADYQKFRAGNVSGSKGEVSDVVVVRPSEPPLKHLGPPLSIIPQSVPLEQLETYRYNYQNFRSGKALGAKGEVYHLRDPRDASAVEWVNVELPKSPKASEGSCQAGGSSGSTSTACGPAGFGAPSLDRAIRRLSTDLAPPGLEVFNLLQKLPPALSILPMSVDLEKLDSYRACYQQFRDENVRWRSDSGVSDDLKEEEEAGAEVSKRLGDPLSILPRSISPGKLAAYRADYQRFRAGQARGAHGEISSQTGK